MGRRSRNKQPSPPPFEPKISSTKLGKRKAEEDNDARLAQRTVKKIKDGKGKSRSVVKKAKSSISAKRNAVGLESSAEDGSGWEDMEDEADLKKEKR